MLKRGTYEPGGRGSFHEGSAADGNGLGRHSFRTQRIKAVIRHPAPDVFEVGRSGFGEVKEGESCFTGSEGAAFGRDEGVD